MTKRLSTFALGASLGLGIAGVTGMALRDHAHAAVPTPAAMTATAAATTLATSITPRTEKPPEAKALSSAFAAAARALGPSVVRIDVESGAPTRRMSQGGPGRQSPGPDADVPEFFRHFFEFGQGQGQGDEPGSGSGGGIRRGTGSGVVMDASGNVITNRHVVEGATKVTVTLSDGTEIPGKVVGSDARTDVAVVRLEKLPKGLTVARLGDSDHLEVGEWVLAIGSPLGLEQTVTAGIVSGKGRAGRRVHMSGDRVRSYIQTDAKINPGNSGGPLANLDGEVVGINTLITAGAGGAYGFAIPINEVRRVSQLLVKDGRVRYPYLGVMVGDLSNLEPEKKATLGANLPSRAAFVSEVSPGGPAAKAGLQSGDIITQIDGQKIEYGADVVDYVSSRGIGSGVKIAFQRTGKPMTTLVSLGELPGADDVRVADSGKIGLGLQNLTPEITGSLGLPGGTRGVVITEVAPGSVAEKAGLKEGEVIIEVDRKPVATVADAVSALQAARPTGHLVRVRGASGARFVTIPAS
jgi:serine protease Do